MMKPTDAIPFTYRDFYDVPRVFICVIEGRKFLLDAPFHDQFDEYSPDYSVYEMPDDLDVENMTSWAELSSRATRMIGQVPVQSIKFDPSLRKTFEGSVLKKLLASNGYEVEDH